MEPGRMSWSWAIWRRSADRDDSREASGSGMKKASLSVSNIYLKKELFNTHLSPYSPLSCRTPLPVLALAKEAGILELLEFLAGIGGHALLFARQNLIEGRCAGAGAAQDETREVLLILERIGLG